MKTLNIMAVRSFIPVFLISLSFFVLIFQLVDLFTYLWRYLNNDIGFIDIATVAYLYLPKCVSFALPPALLFSIAFTLGTFYANNELISIFGSGISLFRFVLPFLFAGMLLSFGVFYFEERVVIDSFKQKNEIQKVLLKQQVSFSNTNLTVLSNNNTVIYRADYYNDKAQTLSGVTVLLVDEEGNFQKRIDGEQALWKDDRWEFRQCRIFTWDEYDEFLTETSQNSYSSEQLNEPPDTFRKSVRDVEEMRMEDAREWIASLRRAGLPYQGVLTEYYTRFSMALTPIVVAFISSALGGRFKKNILLMSLLSSLVLTVIYYVIQMILVLIAKLGYIPPTAGAWGTFLIFLIPGLWLFRSART